LLDLFFVLLYSGKKCLFLALRIFNQRFVESFCFRLIFQPIIAQSHFSSENQ
jgi:hypothetical protein